MHPATLLRRIALTLLSACALTTLVEAQSAPKALVYCPVGLDTSGCDNVVAALSAPGSAFTGGVDRGYDGSGATVDLAAANLAGYAVIVVPSLADDPQTKPYARLRNATVAAHLRAALTGHRAVWSGTPDLGTANPAEKTALLQNLATWAAGGSGTGLVALLDNSDDVTLRYDWLPGVAGFAVVADTSLDSYAAVQSLTGAGAAIVTVGGQALAYGNMAAFGIHAAVVSGVSEDVRGVAVDGSAGMPVLVTAAGSAPTTSTPPPPPPPPPPAPSGLRALVYCPVSLDSRSCDNVIAALTASGTSFAGGVDRGYNGAGGTVDLRTADLSPYGVFIVPSLADGEQAQPYAMLRDPAVAGRLKPILQGPVAVWSGTPDLGDSSQEKKNILIMNLAKWAAGARLTAGQQGLVAFQDASDA
ncbi:MAG TPA: hypothetical protein VFS33_00755, partial [Gemmatimonadales bacterium]|nr:hypothetical protein [Gemmatimonadales bacterium]